MKNPKVAKTYNPGDVCFAKVRGFPHWPARVVALAEENTLKQFRYHVVFFGTGERALVKAEDMLDYFDNKARLGRLFSKRKVFQDGMEDIAHYIKSTGLEVVEDAEADLADDGVSDKDQPSTAAVVADDAAEGKPAAADAAAAESASEDDALVIDEAPLRNGAAGPKAAAAGGNSRKRPAAKGRKSEGAPADKRQRRSAPSATPQPPAAGVETSPAVTSRSGRKIKPKKFSDDLDDSATDDAASVATAAPTPVPTPAPTPAPRGRKAATPAAGAKRSTSSYSPDTDPHLLELSAPNFTEDDANGMPILDCTDNMSGRTLLVKTPNGQLCKVKIDMNRPATFAGDEARRLWDEAVAKAASQLKIDILEGEVTVDEYLASVRKRDKDRSRDAARKNAELLERKTGKLKLVNWLKIESRLVELDMLVKVNLGLNKSDVDASLPFLDELGAMVIDPLMLKKHPQIVETIKKLRRYVGNTDIWNFTDAQLIEFKSKALQVRQKADFIYNKMKSLFIIPYPETFWGVFTESVRVFQEKVKGLDLDLVYRIIDDPTEVTPQDLPMADKSEPADASSKGLPPLDESANGQPPLDESANGQPPLDESANDQPPLDESANGQPPLDESANVQPPLDESANVQPPPQAATANGPLPLDSDSEVENQPPAE